MKTKAMCAVTAMLFTLLTFSGASAVSTDDIWKMKEAPVYVRVTDLTTQSVREACGSLPVTEAELRAILADAGHQPLLPTEWPAGYQMNHCQFSYTDPNISPMITVNIGAQNPDRLEEKDGFRIEQWDMSANRSDLFKRGVISYTNGAESTILFEINLVPRNAVPVSSTNAANFANGLKIHKYEMSGWKYVEAALGSDLEKTEDILYYRIASKTAPEETALTLLASMK